MMRSTMMRQGSGTRRVGRAAVALSVTLAACASLERNPNVVSPYSDKLSPYNYKEEGMLALMVAGGGAGPFLPQGTHFPLFVQVAKKTKWAFEITRAAFTLED